MRDLTDLIGRYRAHWLEREGYSAGTDHRITDIP